MIIGIIGKAGVGKDTLAEMVIDEYSISKTNNSRNKITRGLSYRPIRVEKFAQGLKMACAAITGKPLSFFMDRSNYNTVLKGLNITARELMQKIGAGLRETVSEDIWVKTALMRCNINDNYIFTDVRFPNELEAIRNSGGFIIHLIRPEFEEKTLVNEEQKNHISETALDDYEIKAHVSIINEGSLEDLEKMVKQIVIKKLLEWEGNLKSDSQSQKEQTP